MTSPILPIDEWRSRLLTGYNPWHFWQLADNTIVPVTSACNTIVNKYAWQSEDAAGRDDIQTAIIAAERRLISYMGYSPGAHFVTEIHAFPRYPDEQVTRLGYTGADARWMSINLNEGKIQTVGVAARTLIGALNVVYTDADGDGLAETFTVSTPVSFTNPDQFALYFQATDRLDADPVSEDYRILPVKVTITGGVATAKGKRWLLVKPLLYEGAKSDVIDPTVNTNFVTALDAYRYYADPTGTTNETAQAKLIWETLPHPFFCSCPSCLGGSNSTDPAAEGYAIARCGIRNAEMGIVTVAQAVYNVTAGTWGSVDWGICRPPDRVEIRYYAGVALEDGLMNKRMQTIVSRLAAAELQNKISACDIALRQLYHWQFDLSRSAGSADESYGLIAADDLANPFGTARGAVYAWKEVRDARRIVGFAV